MDHKAGDDQEISSFVGDQHPAGERAVEPVRSRWTPKPEQILILESIFNSGMVNPAKDETVRIRKLLEKFGAVGDANVFYWFQNRRSRSRRRQRQIQAAGLSSSTHHDQYYPNCSSSNSGTSPPPPLTTQLLPQLQAVVSDQPSVGVIISATRPVLLPAVGDHQYLQYLHHDNLVRSPASGTVHPSASSYNSNFDSAGTHGRSSSSTSSNCEGQVYSQLFHQHHEQAAGDLTNIFDQYAPADSTSSLMWPCDDATLRYHSGTISVFINGVATEVPRGPINIRLMFGEDFILVHASGEPLSVNEFGMSFQSLQSGESYFLKVFSITVAFGPLDFDPVAQIYPPKKAGWWRGFGRPRCNGTKTCISRRKLSMSWQGRREPFSPLTFV